MKLSRQRAASLGVLALGIAALAADRLGFFPGGSITAPLASEAASLLIVPSEPTAALAAPKPRAEAPPAPSERLAALAISQNFDLENVRDAFSSRVPASNAATPGPGEEAATPGAISAAEFKRTHKFTSVITPRNGNAMILVGREAVSIGGVLDGFTLESVAGDEAVFRRGDERVTLQRAGRTENR